MPDALLVDPCNFVDYPAGGQLSFAKQMMMAYGNRLALVGVCTDRGPVGRWTRRQFDGTTFDCFSFCRCRPTHRRPLVPGRILVFSGLLRFRDAIFRRGIDNLFTQSPEALIALSPLPWRSICYCLAGAESPLRRPRYGWARLLSGLFEIPWLRAIRRADVVLASADQASIDRFLRERPSLRSGTRILPFPTRYDQTVFYPVEKDLARATLGIPPDQVVVASVGRINIAKGWDLILDAFRIFWRKLPASRIYFVGDGEDRKRLLRRAIALGIQDRVNVTGFLNAQMVANYINSADLVVFGSHHEGWSVAMLEALACGKPVVSTEVSGSREMIRDGLNGFVIPNRDADCMAKAMHDALGLEQATEVSISIASRYTIAGLSHNLGQLWPPLG